MATDLPEFDRNDQGKGSFSNYKYGLVPNNGRVRMRLAGSNPYQAALKEIVEGGNGLLAIGRGHAARKPS